MPCDAAKLLLLTERFTSECPLWIGAGNCMEKTHHPWSMNACMSSLNRTTTLWTSRSLCMTFAPTILNFYCNHAIINALKVSNSNSYCSPSIGLLVDDLFPSIWLALSRLSWLFTYMRTCSNAKDVKSNIERSQNVLHSEGFVHINAIL